MESIVCISDAVSLAFHAVVLLASHSNSRLSNKQIASDIHVSEAHLSKVLQRLVKVGLVRSTRGPRGGFKLGKRAETIKLLDVYETIEGPYDHANCLFGQPVCDRGTCIFGGLLESIQVQIYHYLSNTRLSDLVEK